MKIPDSWTTAQLGSVANVQMGQSPDSTSYNKDKAGLPFFQGKAEFGKLHPVVRKWCSAPAKIAESGDILLSIRAPVGPTNVADVQCAIGRGLAAIRVLDGINSSYLLQCLRSLAPQLAAKATGTTFPAVGGDVVRSLELPVAPEAEQKRIADKLDTVLTRVDAVNARLARVAPLIKRFRQSVLAAATSGRLTEDWRSANASTSDWDDAQIGDLLQEKPRNGYSPKAVDHETPVRSLTLSATTTGRFRAECYKFVPDDIAPDSHLWLSKGDVLIQRANSLEYVGVSAIVDVEVHGYIYPDLMMKCRANSRTSPPFLHLLLSAESTRKYFRDNATGTAGNMPKINQQTVISAPCRVPGTAEQSEIVRRVETLFAFADRLEARLQAARTAAERLTPALLAKAFRGELVPQDPNDEPAAELLKRLAAGAPATTKRRGRPAKAA